MVFLYYLTSYGFFLTDIRHLFQKTYCKKITTDLCCSNKLTNIKGDIIYGSLSRIRENFY